MTMILVIDDDELIAGLLQSVLAEGGHSATAIATLDQVGDQAGAERFGLVIADLVTTTAYSAAGAARWVAAIRQRVPGVPVIVCTAHRSAANDEADIAADAILTKPFDVEALLTLVQRLTARATG